MNHTVITLDVRDDLRSGRDPFAKIMAAAAQVAVGQVLLLIAPFEPIPLFHVLGRQGFRYDARRCDSGEWEVRFTRGSEESVDVEGGSDTGMNQCGGAQNKALEIQDLDARGLEPPQPLVNILEALACLPVSAQLAAHTDRRPIHLYPLLQERGFNSQTEEQSDGSFITNIRRS